MVNITTLATGSSGNCYLLEENGCKLLIEAGITFKEIQKKLDFQTNDLVGCLVTHSHLDHSKGVKTLLDRGIDIYMSKGEQESLKLKNVRLRTIKSKESFRVGKFLVMPFESYHDVVEGLNFLIKSDGGSIVLFATDTYMIKYRFPGLTHIMLEVNYDNKTLNSNLESGNLNKYLMKRVVASHMSLETALTFFESNDLSNVEEIHLLHLSNGNSNEKRIYEEVSKTTGKQIFIP